MPTDRDEGPVAEQERKTKAERREEKRQRRLEEERAAAAAAKKARTRNIIVFVTLLAVLGGLGYLAAGNVGTTVDQAITVTATEAAAARESAECEVLQVAELPGRDHLEPAAAPPEDVLYTNGRPTASGPHYLNPGPIFSGVRDQQLDERATTHNMEHGSVIFWFDPEVLSDEDVDELDTMVASLNDSGFASLQGRAGILAAPFIEPGLPEGVGVAVRSWGRGMDCASWDLDYAYAWIIEVFGSRGPAPEARIGQYPEDVLEYDPDDVPDAPTTIVLPSDGDEDDATDEDATDDGTSDDDATDATDDDATDDTSSDDGEG